MGDSSISLILRRVIVEGNEFGDSRRAYPAGEPLVGVEWRDLMVVELGGDDRRAAAMVRERLIEMGQTLKRTARPKELQDLAGAIGDWPSIRHDLNDQGSWETKLRPVHPTSKEISQMVEVLGWLLWLGPAERGVVFAQALDISFEKYARLDTRRRSKTSIIRAFNRGIGEIVATLRKKRVDRLDRN